MLPLGSSTRFDAFRPGPCLRRPGYPGQFLFPLLVFFYVGEVQLAGSIENAALLDPVSAF